MIAPDRQIESAATKVANERRRSYDNIGRAAPVLFTLEGSPAAGTTTEQLEGLLRAEVSRIAQEGVAEQELQRVKTQLIASQIYKRDSIFGQAMEIGTMNDQAFSPGAYRPHHREIEEW